MPKSHGLPQRAPGGPTPASRHDGPAVDPSVPAGPWPPCTTGARRFGTLIRLTGPFTDADLSELRSALSGRPVTRTGQSMTVWPAGTGSAVTYDDGRVSLRGIFDELDLGALRAAYPGRQLDIDGDIVTLRPPGGPDGQLP
ncbi:hypothetical protein [Streptomyces sp. NPDC058595]|uniref:hypothetical protein n=1 Tax=Streptomyces sp. NPDC058595 TaxID=3346550 RepID=UPI00364A4C67